MVVVVVVVVVGIIVHTHTHTYILWAISMLNIRKWKYLAMTPIWLKYTYCCSITCVTCMCVCVSFPFTMSSYVCSKQMIRLWSFGQWRWCPICAVFSFHLYMFGGIERLLDVSTRNEYIYSNRTLFPFVIGRDFTHTRIQTRDQYKRH